MDRPSYHHGALREALIDATDTLLAERGLEGFSLREVARRSGVSPAAPAHHFGDADGLLTAVATSAFDGLSAALAAGDARGGSDPAAQLREQGVGYVGFALRHPGRFGLMFRSTHRPDEGLQRSAQAAFTRLEDGVRRLYGVAAGDALSDAQVHALLAIWSLVHGFAHLALAGQIQHRAPPVGQHRGTRGGVPALLREVVAPMLEQHLRALVPPAAAAAAKPRAKATAAPKLLRPTQTRRQAR
jgi:AcrR family transcriptional regulator